MKRIDTTINPYIHPNTFLRELGSNVGEYPFIVFASEFYNSNLGLVTSDVINKIEVEVTLYNQEFLPFIAIGDYNNVYKEVNHNIEQISGNPANSYVSHGVASFHHNTYYIKNTESSARTFKITITPVATLSNSDSIFIGSVFRNYVEKLEHKYPLNSKVKFYTTNNKVVERELSTQNKRILDYRFFLDGYNGGIHIDSFTSRKNSQSENTITYLYGRNNIPIFTHKENIFNFSASSNGSFTGYQYLYRNSIGGTQSNYLIAFNNSTNFILHVRDYNSTVVIYQNNNVISLYVDGEEKTLVAPFLPPNFTQDVLVNQENYPLEDSVGYLREDGSVQWFRYIRATPSVEGGSAQNSRLCRGGQYFKVHTRTTLPLMIRM